MVKVKSSFIFIILIVLVFGISACTHTESPPTGFSNPKKAVKNLLTENYGTGNYFIVNEHKIENEIYYVVNIGYEQDSSVFKGKQNTFTIFAAEKNENENGLYQIKKYGSDVALEHDDSPGQYCIAKLSKISKNIIIGILYDNNMKPFYDDIPVKLSTHNTFSIMVNPGDSQSIEFL